MDSSRKNFNQYNGDEVTILHPSKIPHLGRAKQIRQEDKWIRNYIRVHHKDITRKSSSKMKTKFQMTRYDYSSKQQFFSRFAIEYNEVFTKFQTREVG